MIEPDRGKVDLDLGDGKTPLKLWYTPGAIRMLCKQIHADLPLSRIHSLLTEYMKPDTLAAFIWAGRLWEERGLKLEAIQERVDWCPRAELELTREVNAAVYLGLTGKALGGDEESASDPEKPAAVSGAGTMPSDSPSAKPVIQ